jgi:uncharacterized protein (DUF433 family)
MNARAKRLFEQALALPPEERRELARKLLESLPDEASPDVATRDVTAVRAREVLDGTSPTRDIDEGLDEAFHAATASARFDMWMKGLAQNEAVLGGEPVFPGSRLAVRHVGGMLLNGAAAAEVKEDYPYLTDEDIEFAKLFVVTAT